MKYQKPEISPVAAVDLIRGTEKPESRTVDAETNPFTGIPTGTLMAYEADE